jgi:hypothetical protein
MKGKRFTTEEKIRILRDADQLNLDMGSVRCLSGHLKDDQPRPDYRRAWSWRPCGPATSS